VTSKSFRNSLKHNSGVAGGGGASGGTYRGAQALGTHQHIFAVI